MSGSCGDGGRGTINYDINKPTHALTSSGTTEFDDELLRRQIVTPHQVFLAKGATPQEAQRLASEWTQKQNQQGRLQHDQDQNQEESQNQALRQFNKKSSHDDDDDSFLDDEDDDKLFMEHYRQERLAQLQEQHRQEKYRRQQQLQQQSTYSPSIRHISRQEWTSHVNDQSYNCWVVVCMTEGSENGFVGGSLSDGEGRNSSSKYHDRVVEELHRIKREFSNDTSSNINLLTIYYKDAISNWPAEHVPAMFAYRQGVKQHEWITSSRGEFPSRDLLEQLFRQWKIIN